MEVRTRFAPSPTGHLHIGGSRTALFCWLYARHHGGKFILRIDDTDPERSSKEMELAILEGLKWLGLDWDEGPYYQSQRLHLYQKAIDELIASGHVYRCVCTSEELEAKRKTAIAQGKNPGYDGTCRNRTDISADEPHVLRFKSPQAGETIIDDGIQGRIVFPNSELDDLVIRRSDGSPTYNFSSVVDDIDMKITHIIRGTDHLNNTHKQYHIFKALGAEPPVFAHMPLTLGPDKTKLSKRHGDTALLAYREKGFLPQAMLNYMVRLGWSHGDEEIFTVKELIEKFDLDGCTKSPGIFDMAKLTWVNEQHIKALNTQELANNLALFLAKIGIQADPSSAKLQMIAESLKPRAKTLVEMAEAAKFYFVEPAEYEAKAEAKLFNAESADILGTILRELPDEIEKETAIKIVHDTANKLGKKLGSVAQPLRLALTGSSASPPIDDVMAILGGQECRKRIERAINHIRKG